MQKFPISCKGLHVPAMGLWGAHGREGLSVLSGLGGGVGGG